MDELPNIQKELPSATDVVGKSLRMHNGATSLYASGETFRQDMDSLLVAGVRTLWSRCIPPVRRAHQVQDPYTRSTRYLIFHQVIECDKQRPMFGSVESRRITVPFISGCSRDQAQNGYKLAKCWTPIASTFPLAGPPKHYVVLYAHCNTMSVYKYGNTEHLRISSITFLLCWRNTQVLHVLKPNRGIFIVFKHSTMRWLQSTPRRGPLPPQKALDLATIYLEQAHKTKDPVLALEICLDAENTLYRIHQSDRKSLVAASASGTDNTDRALCKAIAATLNNVGELFDNLGHPAHSKRGYKYVAKWGHFLKALIKIIKPST
ncbi:hypothetical protein BCR41DRAFT_374659 [Lobosporangium transversale]|uniref:Uncharacterized protein n=1 Tax=Lobosporangium transversale TaxID=64571 RepID=A0A1Y2G9P6_9FUNG|nr:hypothetical protein BCR41DRAFT_374659 [Lobosporangium transversale]ORZ04987.1 hypothetical protein BCR41DRAFT_374659 [Lobosporangium transversale]|eukprot:XP_021876851.1 hypothetical protein BCR41DRAFT_374659 [Lobosporangium transversale]